MQTTDTILMIEPVAFGYNVQTAEDNYFQTNAENQETQSIALAEFNSFVNLLRNKGVKVIVVKDTLSPHTPDSIFPNNWVSFGTNGQVVLYPMFASNRRDERRLDIIEKVKAEGFMVKDVLDFTQPENEGKYLEGTGSIVFDHTNRIAYGSASVRLDESLFRKFCKGIGYQPVLFHSFHTVNGNRLPIYHTNVMMTIGNHFAVVCLSAIDSDTEREQVVQSLRQSNKEIIEITEEQMNNYAGNMLQIHNSKGKKLLVMSKTAYDSLRNDQISALQKYSEIIYTDLHTIEVNGGGSARCMLAEIFLPKQ